MAPAMIWHNDNATAEQVATRGIDDLLDDWAMWIGEDKEKEEALMGVLRKTWPELKDMLECYLDDE